MGKLRIDPEFKNLIPPLNKEEFAQLEKNILQDGCRDPLVVWNNTIIDGHNRYEICDKHNLEYKTQEYTFISNDAVIAWMEDNQLGRRNLTPDQFRYFLGRKYNREKQQGSRSDLTSDQNDQKLPTDERIAKENGVSAPTVRRAGSAVAKIEKATPELKTAVKDGDISLPAASIIAAQPKEKQGIILNKVVSGEAKNPKQAIRQIEQEDRINNAPYISSPLVNIKKGDCLTLTRDADVKIDVVITDPPYGIETHNTRRGGKDYSDGEDYALTLLDSLCDELFQKCSPDAHLYFFSGYSYYPQFKEILSRWFDVQDNPLIWVKENHTMCDFSTAYPSKHEYIIFCRMPGSKRKLSNCVPDVLNFKRERSSTHSAEKPTELLKLLIDQSSFPGQVILDPFMGSGSTGVAAKELGREFVGFELEQEWFEVAESRLA